MKQYISSVLTNNSFALHAYLLDHQMEEKIIKKDEDAFDEIFVLEILNAVEKIIEENRNNIYPVLSTVEVRRKFSQIVKKKFPDLAVVCYQELSSFTNITPVSKISINSLATALTSNS